MQLSSNMVVYEGEINLLSFQRFVLTDRLCYRLSDHSEVSLMNFFLVISSLALNERCEYLAIFS